jgi:hypothetical protein
MRQSQTERAGFDLELRNSIARRSEASGGDSRSGGWGKDVGRSLFLSVGLLDKSMPAGGGAESEEARAEGGGRVWREGS